MARQAALEVILAVWTTTKEPIAIYKMEGLFFNVNNGYIEGIVRVSRSKVTGPSQRPESWTPTAQNFNESEY